MRLLSYVLHIKEVVGRVNISFLNYLLCYVRLALINMFLPLLS